MSCGLCCNGVIFGDVKVRRREEAERLLALGLPIRPATARPYATCAQPCAAYDGQRCRVYANRPQHCRDFECLLLQKVQGGSVKPAAALRLIRRTKKLADQVSQLIQELGGAESGKSLRAQFRSLAGKLARTKLDQNTAAKYARLTLAFQDLNLLLSSEFYPG